jgi:hypothetical protein
MSYRFQITPENLHETCMSQLLLFLEKMIIEEWFDEEITRDELVLILKKCGTDISNKEFAKMKRQLDQRTKCTGIVTKTKNPCTNYCKDGYDFCGIHLPKEIKKQISTEKKSKKTIPSSLTQHMQNESSSDTEMINEPTNEPTNDITIVQHTSNTNVGDNSTQPQPKTVQRLKKNMNNNYVWPGTSLIIHSKQNIKVVATEGIFGEWLPLIERDIKMCKKIGLRYQIIDNLEAERAAVQQSMLYRNVNGSS